MKNFNTEAQRRRGSSFIWVLVGILLVAAALRLVGITQISPPGIEHDEVANWLIDRLILSGEHAIYFTRAYGHEAGYHYWQALLVALIGDNALALRLASSYLGLIGVAVSFVLARKLFGWQVGIVAMGITAVLFFPRVLQPPGTAGYHSARFLWFIRLLLVARLGVQKSESFICPRRSLRRIKFVHLHGRPRRAYFLWAVCGLFSAFFIGGCLRGAGEAWRYLLSCLPS
ncbi:MAG: glycosyltransferase family 39 protein [Chloroflexi bacterium]|nr:glycosyltransferase family 39 protein [Chloroflexota bacterium]